MSPSSIAGPSRTAITSLRTIGVHCASRWQPPLSSLVASPKAFSRRQLHPSRPTLSGLQNIFETADLPSLTITKLTSRGFHLSDDLVVPGGVVFLGGRALLWDVDPPGSTTGGIEAAWKGWTAERFKVFETVVPRPEILLLGTGQQVIPAPKAIKDYISSLGIQLDVMDSRNAASTYNLLSEEGRTIGAALCPLKPIDPRTGGSR